MMNIKQKLKCSIKEDFWNYINVDVMQGGCSFIDRNFMCVWLSWLLSFGFGLKSTSENLLQNYKLQLDIFSWIFYKI